MSPSGLPRKKGWTIRIIIDEQEQAPWRFSPEITCLRRSLDTGDYTIESYESLICVERKSLPDLVRTVIHDWIRFTKQLRRMACMDHAMIVVEATLTALMKHEYPGDINPNSVRGKLNAIYLDYGIPTLFLEDRSQAATWVENMFELYVKRKTNAK